MVEQAKNDDKKLEEYDPTANPVGNLPLFDEIDEIDDHSTKLESKKTKVDPEEDIPTPANVNKQEPKQFALPHMKRPRKTLAQMAAEAQKESTGGKIVCPDCGCQDFRTTNTKVVEGFRKRLRICRHCGRPVDTIEFAIRE